MTTWKDEDDAPPLTGDDLDHPQGHGKECTVSLNHDRGVAIVDEALDPLVGDTVFGQRWGSGASIKLTPEELGAMNEGQIIAVDVEGEYVVYLQRNAKSGDWVQPLLSESALAEDWLKPEEDAAWAYLQPIRSPLPTYAVTAGDG